MRKIKFKGWDGKKMTREYTLYEMLYFQLPNNGLKHNWLQYTGLKDKNGKKIFEGDIIEAYEFIQKPKMVVKFDGEMAGFIPFIWKQALEYQDYIGYFAHEDWCIVIGNIYENPELLDNK